MTRFDIKALIDSEDEIEEVKRNGHEYGVN